MSKYNLIFQGDCINILKNQIDEKSVDLIFADPPYFLQLENELTRPNDEKYNGVEEEWDKFNSFQEYDEFSRKWLEGCRTVLKDNGSIWVIGTYHNIFRLGKIMTDLGFWIINDIIWVKTNPTPNFKGRRFTNAHETLLWATKSKQSNKTFNYRAMKNKNEDKQMRSDWHIPICNGNERLKIDKSKAHPTQKPEALLRRIILSTSNPGDIVLDPFFGTGTTGAVAKKLKRNWIGIESNQEYIDVASERIKNIEEPSDLEELYFTYSRRNLQKVPFGSLVETQLIKEGTILFSNNMDYSATVNADGSITSNDINGSIHKVGSKIQNLKSCNGWDFWFIKKGNEFISIDKYRNEYRKKFLDYDGPELV